MVGGCFTGIALNKRRGSERRTRVADQIDIEGVQMSDFAEWFAELDHGNVNQIVSAKLGELASAVQETGKVGKLAITVVLKKEGTLALAVANVKVTKPEHPSHGTLFHFGPGCTLMREDPRQLSMREVKDPPRRAPEKPPEREPASAPAQRLRSVAPIAKTHAAASVVEKSDDKDNQPF
jgi:hypothetical protein